MTDQTVLQYIKLAGRRLQIIKSSGVNWKPEYGSELIKIDVELARLRKEVNAEHKRKEKNRGKF